MLRGKSLHSFSLNIALTVELMQVWPLQAPEAHLGFPRRSFCQRQRPRHHVSFNFFVDYNTLLTSTIFSAKMEAQENDIPPSAPFKVSGFPTLKFKPAGSKEFLDYDGDRSLESLIAFVEENAKNSLEPKEATPQNETVPEVHDEL